MAGKDAGSRRAILAACRKMLATLLFSSEREAWMEMEDEVQEIRSAVES